MAKGELIILEVDGERAVIWHPLLSPEDTQQLSAMLRTEQVFVGTFVEDPYRTSLYIQQEGLHDTKTLLLFDTNVLTRVIELARGREATKEHLVPAAIMAFASASRMQTLPAGGLYEEALRRQGRDSNLDLAYFHEGDDLDPREWVDIAFERKVRLRSALSPQHIEKHDFVKPIQTFGFVYPHVLKLALLELQGGSREHRFLEFIHWQFEHWIFSASANLLALRIFSSQPPRGALKNLRSPNREAAINGIKNAANDLAFANTYMNLCKEQSDRNELAVFCSLDSLLRDIVLDLQTSTLGIDVVTQRIESQFGQHVVETYNKLNVALSDSDKRLYNKEESYQISIVSSLEQQILSRSF